MRHHQLGTSDLQVSEISLGCMSLGTDPRHATPILHKAVDLGVTTFDTADLYDKGENERIIGKALKGMRKDLILASKVGNQWRPDGSGWIGIRAKPISNLAIFETLQRLQTDYLDLYQLHGGTIEDPIDETIEAFEELKQAGWIREYGISSIRPNVIREYLQRSTIASTMTQYSLLDRRPEESTLDLMKEANVSVIVRGAVAKGYLLNKEAKDYLGHSISDIEQVQRKLREFSNDRGPAQMAIQYSLHHPSVATVAIGASSIANWEENLVAASLPPLSEEEVQQMKSWVQAFHYESIARWKSLMNDLHFVDDPFVLLADL